MSEPHRRVILFIEDDREVAALIIEELREDGFDVITYEDMPKSILWDVSMPGMSRLELVDRLCAIAQRLGYIPLMCLTGANDRDRKLKDASLAAEQVSKRSTSDVRSAARPSRPRRELKLVR